MIKNILLPLKGSRAEWDTEVFQLACTLTKRTKGKIRAIYIIEVSRDLPVDAEIKAETKRAEEVLRLAESLAIEAKCPLEAEIFQARLAGPAIIQQTITKEIDAIVMSLDYEHDPTSLQISDTARYILKNARCPVLLWQNRRPERFRIEG